MNINTGNQVAGYIAQITALQNSIAATQAAMASGASLINVQLNGQAPIDLSTIGLTAAQTSTILNSLNNFLNTILTATTNNLTAVP